MFTGESLIGRRVLARQEGQMLDSVKDVVIDTAQRRVVALLINEGRLFSAPTVVPLEKVVSIGDDAVVVADAASAVAVDQYPMVKEILDRDDRLVGKEVYTDAGLAFGKVVDVKFDLPHGNVSELKVASKSDDDRPVTDVSVAVSDVVSIGPHAVVISRSVPGVATAQQDTNASQAPGAVDALPTSRLAEESTTGGSWSARRANDEPPQSGSGGPFTDGTESPQ
jgi:uncharacterized protein YrrD